MPTLHWIGKDAVLNHHKQVLFRLLKCNEKLSFDVKLEKTKITVKGNMITSWIVESIEGAGLQAILSQLGIAEPIK